jgi:hypothetical protein
VGDNSRSPRLPRRNETGVYRDASYRILERIQTRVLDIGVLLRVVRRGSQVSDRAV